MILKSRKFWLAIFDILISTATYFVTKYAAPAIGADVLWLIGSWQPAIVMLIAGIAIEDAAEKRAG
jgi:hypothetical protein